MIVQTSRAATVETNTQYQQHNLNVRHMPIDLMRKLRVRAAQDGVHMRTLVIRLLAASLARAGKEAKP